MADRIRTCIMFDSEGAFAGVVVSDDVEVYSIDESAPHDRIYRMTVTPDPDRVATLIGTNDIGSAQDGRHAAIMARVRAFLAGCRHLRSVEPDARPEGEG